MSPPQRPSSPIITLTSDFGWRDGYVAAENGLLHYVLAERGVPGELAALKARRESASMTLKRSGVRVPPGVPNTGIAFGSLVTYRV